MPPLVMQVFQIALLILVFSFGLHGKFGDMVSVFRQPRLLLAAVISVNVIVPVVALTLASMFPLAPATRAGICAMAIAPMAPFLPGKLLKLTGHRVAIGLYSALIIIAIIAVPLTVWLAGRIFGEDFGVPMSNIAKMVFVSILLPLLAGTVFAHFFPEISPKLAKIATILAYLGMVPVVLLILWNAAGGIVSLIGDGSVAVIVVTVLVGLVLGHALGGPGVANQQVIAQAAVTRHPGIAAMIIQANAFDKKAMMAVLLFLVLSVILSTLYAKWIAPRDAAKATASAETL